MLSFRQTSEVWCHRFSPLTLLLSSARWSVCVDFWTFRHKIDTVFDNFTYSDAKSGWLLIDREGRQIGSKLGVKITGESVFNKEISFSYNWGMKFGWLTNLTTDLKKYWKDRLTRMLLLSHWRHETNHLHILHISFNLLYLSRFFVVNVEEASDNIKSIRRIQSISAMCGSYHPSKN